MVWIRMVHRSIYFNARSPVCVTVWQGLGARPCWRRCVTGDPVFGFKNSCYSQLSLSLSAPWCLSEHVNFQLLLLGHPCLCHVLCNDCHEHTLWNYNSSKLFFSVGGLGNGVLKQLYRKNKKCETTFFSFHLSPVDRRISFLLILVNMEGYGV